MRKAIVLAAILMLVAVPFMTCATPNEQSSRAESRAQDDIIEWVNPRPTGSTLNGVAWKTGQDHALIVGQAGCVMKFVPFAGQKFTVLQSGTSEDLNAIAYKPGGNYALMAGDGGLLLKYDGTSFSPIGTSLSYDLLDIAWKTDGSRAVICGMEGTALSFDGVSATRLNTSTNFDFRTVAWIPGTDSFLLAGEKGAVYRGNASSCSKLDAPVTKDIYDIAYRPDGSFAVLVGQDGTVLKYDGAVLSSINSFPFQNFYALAWKPDGSSALVVGLDVDAQVSTSYILDATTMYRVPNNITVTMKAVIWEQGADMALIIGSRGLVAEYSAGSFDNLSSAQMYDMTSVAWRPDGSIALIAGSSGYLTRLNGSRLEPVVSGTSNELKCVAWHPSGEYALVCGRGNTVLRYNATNNTVEQLDTKLVVGVNFTSASWKSDGTCALLTGEGGKIVKFNGTDFGLQQVIGSLAVNYMDVAWKPGGNYALIAGVSGNILRYEERALPAPLDFCVTKAGTAGPPSTAYFGISWKRNPSVTDALISGSNGVMAHYNETGMYAMATDTTRYIYGVDYLPNSTYALAAGAYGKLLLFVGYGFIHPTGGTDASFLDIAWKPDGAYAVLTGQSGMVMKYYIGRRTSPNAIISSPKTNTVFEPAAVILFDCANSTPTFEDILTYYWSSDISGKLGATSRFTKALDPGSHTITLWANDTQGHSSQATVHIIVKTPNRAPSVTLLAPREGAVYNNTDTVTFDSAGTFDPDVDPLTYYWTSSRSGHLNDTPAFSTRLNIGAHQIILWVNDSNGHNVSRTANITILLFNRAPVAGVLSPVADETYLSNESISFDASTSRDDDGDTLSCYWTSNVSGYLGGTARFKRVLPLGHHRITVWVDDGKGGNVSLAFNITVIASNEPPVASIEFPGEGGTVRDTVEFSGICTDAESTLKFVNVSIDNGPWQNAEGTRNWTFRFNTTSLSNGQHTITVRASDGSLESLDVVRMFRVHNSFWGFSVVASFPIDSTTVKGNVKLLGTASRLNSTIQNVEIQIDDGKWTTASGISPWEKQWDTTLVKNGWHRISVRAFDGTDTSLETTIMLKVDNEPVAQTPWSIITAVVIILVVVLVAGVAMMMRQKPAHGKGRKDRLGNEEE